MPPEIGKLKNLQKLHLWRTNLKELPPEIGYLQNLQELYLMIEKLPTEIGQLQNLQKLHLMIEELPTEIGQLQTLQELYLNTYCGTKSLSKIGQLQNLKIFYLEANEITVLPPEIGQLENLKELYLQAVKITALPPEIGKLQNLKRLTLACPKVAKLPPEIGQLKNLQILEFQSLRDDDLMFEFKGKGNIFAELPPEIGQLQNLKYFWLRDNRLAELPPEIGQLQNLQKLDLRDNQLIGLPPEIEQLQNLEEISLDNPIQDLSALANHPNPKLKVWAFGVELPRQYWTHLSQWKAEWLLTENNAEIRRLLIQQIGYDRICQELQTVKLDSWREYTLLKIDTHVDEESIHLLKMTCPSTNRIHVLRTPPNITSAREAIAWCNWDIDPEAFVVET